VTVAGRLVALDLSVDRAAMPAQLQSNLRRRKLLPAQRRNEVSFRLGELAVRHGCNPFLPDEEAASIAAPHLI
jgi:hypothetical protein